MPACPSCGRENPADARFCNACGTPLSPAPTEREQRKVVTVLFCDLVGSTALGESSDPEALRGRMRRYFEDVRAILERHGGTVEKFVGDAVMTVFGIPVSHEDDALRALRAAAEMREAIAAHGLEARIGINTGEVVVGGEGETLVTGDAVNVAARLEQAASPGEVLIGAETRLLVRDAVRLGEVESLALRGKAEPVQAYRLLELLPGAEALARHLETPLVGRDRERERLWRDFQDAVADRSSRLFTLLGPAGIGKSRLVADFLERLGDSADLLRGRCLPYGEGITYWPLVEMLVAVGVDSDTVLGTSPQETQLAFRRLLEARAAERPQVVVVDDLQWAEPTFLDLVEHVADLSRGAPIFLLCVARTELLDVRPAWGGGKPNATSLLLEPLDEGECEALIATLLGPGLLEEGLRERITTASEGNPLFVEEMLAMVRERAGDAEIAVPPTIHALLQARIDSLDGEVRVVMERGAVEGEVFHRGAVAELAPAPVRPAVESHLATLVRKELIRATTPTFPEDEGFRFRHLLIRDAAYESLPKATRAELHERFAEWLSKHELVERDEILGYHLEQALRYRSEIDPSHPSLSDLAGRASGHLAVAGRGALDLGDFKAGRNLLRRAVEALPVGDERRSALAPDYALALYQSGAFDEVQAVLTEARSAQDEVSVARAALIEVTLDLTREGAISDDERTAARERARAVLERARNDEGIILYWSSIAREELLRCRAAETIAACEEGLRQADRVGMSFVARDLVGSIRSSLVWGPTPAVEALERLGEQRFTAGGALASAGTSAAVGRLLAMRGEIERGRQLVAEARETISAAGLHVSAAAAAMNAAFVEDRAGDFASWERVLRDGLDELERLGDRAHLATAALYLAECLYYQGRHEDAADLCARARDVSPEADLINFVYLDALEGCLQARRGRIHEAQERARRAVARADETDYYFVRAESRRYLAETLMRAGEATEAARAAAEALVILEAKGDVALAAQFRLRFADLGTSD